MIKKILEVNREEFKICEVKVIREKKWFGLSEDTWRVHYYEKDKYTLEKEKY